MQQESQKNVGGNFKKTGGEYKSQSRHGVRADGSMQDFNKDNGGGYDYDEHQ